MKMNFLSGTSAAVFMALGVGLAAQTPAPNPAQSSSAGSPNRLMVTGCVQSAASGPTGTSGTVGSASGETKFHLTNVAPSTPGGGPSTSASPPASTYRLDADDAKLTPLVGHKVEISGTIDAASASGTPNPSAASPSGNAPKLKVDTAKMVAATCTD